jgi:UDP-N-acetylmuramoyl-tripeptide--D-alanyl-D-alanine ligase
MTLRLQDVARVVGADGAPPPAAKVAGWSVDTRTLNPGDVYFALQGPNHDGHRFVAAAFEKDAAAVVVEIEQYLRSLTVAPPGGGERPLTEPRPSGSGGVPVHILAVRDTLQALQDAGAWARRQWAGAVIAVTGSAGKTTTKDAIAHLLSVKMPVGRTIGNLNNHVGVPLSILQLPDAARAAVLEMGMNHAGEIRKLAAIARPDIGVVTNVGYAHVEFFEEGIEGVAAAKRELIEALPPGGVAVLNGDDARVRAFRDRYPGRSLTFGFSKEADVRVERCEASAAGMRFRALGVEFETPMAGRHAVMNLAAAIAVARVFEIPPESLREPVRGFSAGRMRGERTEHNGVVVWDDCYNSNPEAAQSMIDVLRETPARRRIAVLGEMLELGRASEALHRRVGRYAAEHGVDLLIGVSGGARAMVDAAVGAGLPPNAAFFLEEAAAAGEMLRELARPGDAVLFKGSRGIRVERALEAFLGDGGRKAGDGGWRIGGGGR